MIEVGDIGVVNKDDCGMTLIAEAEVIQTPRGEGDTWGFRNIKTGAEIYTTERFTFYKKAKDGAAG